MAATFGDFASVTDAFNAAAVDPSAWNAAMEEVATATGSFGAILLPVRGRQTPLVPMTDSMRAVADDFFRQGWPERAEPRSTWSAALMRRRAINNFDYMTLEKMACDPYHQTLIAPHGLRWSAGVRVGDGEDVWGLSLHRRAEQDQFSPAELERMAKLSLALAGPAKLAIAVGFARVDATLCAFEQSHSPVAMIDRDGAVIRLNSSAEGLLGSDLRVVHRRLVSWSCDATRALDRALSELLWRRRSGEFQPPVVLPRRGGRPIIAYPSRLSSVVSEAFTFCQGLIVFVDLETRLNLVAADLRRVFNLTAAEARLAERLLSEESLKAAAESLRVATGTARNQLKAIYEKTDTHSQAQLIALIARLATSCRAATA
jgi:DNA-binding CsgD family transcriptional regulator/PAS domain-containing protein